MTSPDDLSGIAKALLKQLTDGRNGPLMRRSLSGDDFTATTHLIAALRLQREAGRHEGDLALTHHAAEETQKRLSAEADVLRLRTALQTLVDASFDYFVHSELHTWEPDVERSMRYLAAKAEAQAAVSEGGTDVTPR
jgi:hypothetical protein